MFNVIELNVMRQGAESAQAHRVAAHLNSMSCWFALSSRALLLSSSLSVCCLSSLCLLVPVFCLRLPDLPLPAVGDIAVVRLDPMEMENNVRRKNHFAANLRNVSPQNTLTW